LAVVACDVRGDKLDTLELDGGVRAEAPEHVDVAGALPVQFVDLASS
jgi:hypothetical protein